MIMNKLMTVDTRNKIHRKYHNHAKHKG